MKFYSKSKEMPDSFHPEEMPLPSSNLLLYSSIPLLGLLLSWKTKALKGSQDNFRTLLIDEFKKFIKEISKAYPARTILALQYCLCAALDEAIMNTQEGQENWAENTLLNIFYKETFGGERFYLILDNMLENPQENAHILEILHLILSLGFKGKNFNKDPLILKAEQQNLSQAILPYLSTSSVLLNTPSHSQKNSHTKRTSLWFFIFFSFLLTSFFRMSLDKKLDNAMRPSLILLEDIFKNGENQ
jgi:type VI secretion system protein ImpK